jgi:hypothetical protein
MNSDEDQYVSLGKLMEIALDCMVSPKTYLTQDLISFLQNKIKLSEVKRFGICI